MLDNQAGLLKTQLNREEVEDCVEEDFDEPTEKNLSDEPIIQSVINPTLPKDVDSDENYVDKLNSI